MLKKYINVFRYFKYVYKYKFKLLIAFLLMLISSIISAFIPKFIEKMIDCIKDGYNQKVIVSIALTFIIALLFQIASKLTSEYIYSLIGKKITFKLKYKILSHLLKLDGDYHCNIRVGELLNVIDGDTFIVEEIATRTIFSIISDLITAIIIFIILLTVQRQLLIVIMFVQLFTVFSQIYFNKKIINHKRNIRNTIGQISDIEQEMIYNISQIIMLNGKNKFFSNFIKKQKLFIKGSLKLDLCFLTNTSIIKLLNMLSTIFVLTYGGYKVKYGTISIGELIAFNIYAEKMFNPIMNIINSNMKIQQSIIAINNIFRILDTPIKILKEDNCVLYNKTLQGKVEFHSVDFAYTKNNKVLNNLNLQFKPNEISSIVGLSGSGKSTISKLLFRLWDVNSGEILLDGIDIRKYNLTFLRKNLSIVSQDVFLLNDTIFNNLTLDSKTKDMELIFNICKKVEIHDFIMSLPNQYNTIVGNSSIKLSGGQKQRISLARAIIKNSLIIILDEFTSSLDNELQNKILKNIKIYLENKTTILITHKLSITQESNVIYVINKGNLIESGTYNELMSHKNIFYKLYKKEAI